MAAGSHPGRHSIYLDQNSFNVTIMAVGKLGMTLRTAQEAAVNAAGNLLREACRESLSLTDHTLDDLAALDHPYARRHGSIRIHGGDLRGGWIRTGEDQVHAQSGRLRAALRGGPVTRQGGPGYEVWVDQAVAPHWRDVVQGTLHMLPRDPLWETAQGPKTIYEMRRAVVRELGRVLRSKAHVRFG
jgi:hypothetical protein